MQGRCLHPPNTAKHSSTALCAREAGEQAGPCLAMNCAASRSACRSCWSRARTSAATASTLDRSQWAWAAVTACRETDSEEAQGQPTLLRTRGPKAARVRPSPTCAMASRESPKAAWATDMSSVSFDWSTSSCSSVRSARRWTRNCAGAGAGRAQSGQGREGVAQHPGSMIMSARQASKHNASAAPATCRPPACREPRPPPAGGACPQAPRTKAVGALMERRVCLTESANDMIKGQGRAIKTQVSHRSRGCFPSHSHARCAPLRLQPPPAGAPSCWGGSG